MIWKTSRLSPSVPDAFGFVEASDHCEGTHFKFVPMFSRIYVRQRNNKGNVPSAPNSRPRILRILRILCAAPASNVRTESSSFTLSSFRFSRPGWRLNYERDFVPGRLAENQVMAGLSLSQFFNPCFRFVEGRQRFAPNRSVTIGGPENVKWWNHGRLRFADYFSFDPGGVSGIPPGFFLLRMSAALPAVRCPDRNPTDRASKSGTVRRVFG